MAVAAVGFALMLSACGGDESEEAEAPATLAEIQSCVEEAGFTTSEEGVSLEELGAIGDIVVSDGAGANVYVNEFETAADAAAVTRAKDGDEVVGNFRIAPGAGATEIGAGEEQAAALEATRTCAE
jgi:hypothetical protein